MIQAKKNRDNKAKQEHTKKDQDKNTQPHNHNSEARTVDYAQENILP